MSEALLFDEQLYSLDAIQQAAYRALAACTFDIIREDGHFTCRPIANVGIDDAALQLAIQEFRKDVLDYQLRLKLKAETESVRNLVLGSVFSRTGLQQ